VVKQLGNRNAVLHIEDLGADGAQDRLVQLALQTFGRLDAVVNNAAIVASSSIHTTDKAFFGASPGSEYCCAILTDQSCPTLFDEKRAVAY